MANEFIAKNGLISKGNIQVTSSVIATSFSGSLMGTSSLSQTSSVLYNTNASINISGQITGSDISTIGYFWLPYGKALNTRNSTDGLVNMIYVANGAECNFGGSNVSDLIFNTGFVEGFRVVNNGNLLIGTVIDNGQKLQVAGKLLVQDAGGAAVPNPDTNAVLVLDNGNNATNFWANIPPVGTFTNTTAVFGVSSNGGFLHGVVYNLESNYMIVTNDGGNGLATTGMAVDGTGNVGINTIAPAANLDVNGSLYTLGGTGNGGIQITAFAGGTWIDLSTNGPSGIGVGGPGVNPFIAYVPVNGDWFTNALAGDVAYRNISGRLLFGTADVSPYVAALSGSNFHVALTGGNVKIGTETDDGSGAILQVSGNVHATNFIGTASLATTSSNGAKAYAYMTFPGTNLTSSAYGCTVSRLGTGLIAVLFQKSLPSSNYAVGFTGFSGSTSTPTGSFAYPFSQTSNGFSMSIQQIVSPLIRADFATASFNVFSQ